MLTWPAKDPDEVLDYSVEWSERLEGGEAIVSSSFTVDSGTITKDSESFAGTRSQVWLSGGTDGTTVELRNRITTSGGRTLERSIALPIISTSATAVPTPYTAPTPANLRSRFAPRFNAVSTEQIASALTRAARMVDESWTEGDFVEGRLLYAAHLLTLDGLGTGAEAQSAAAGTTGFRVIKSGSLSLERGAQGSGASASGLNATAFGQQFRQLLALNVGGVRVASGATRTYHGAANDWPAGWWWY